MYERLAQQTEVLDCEVQSRGAGRQHDVGGIAGEEQAPVPQRLADVADEALTPPTSSPAN